jgi:hypothetical protein
MEFKSESTMKDNAKHGAEAGVLYQETLATKDIVSSTEDLAENDDAIESTQFGRAVWFIAMTASMGGFLFGENFRDVEMLLFQLFHRSSRLSLPDNPSHNGDSIRPLTPTRLRYWSHFCRFGQFGRRFGSDPVVF